MCEQTKVHQYKKGMTIIGSAGVEEVYSTSVESGYHDIHTIALQERTYGGAGLCMALAYAYAQPKEPVYFHSIVGEMNQKQDTDAQALKTLLRSHSNISVHFQTKQGLVTEKNIILLQDGKRYGYRLGDTQSQLARESFNPKDQSLMESFKRSHSLIVTSLHPKVALTLFKDFTRVQLDRVCTCYTINSSIATALRSSDDIQEKLSEVVDVMCLSEEEFEMIGGYMSILARKVPILYVTKGDQGGIVIDNGDGMHQSIRTAAFKVKRVHNDNGAGEAAHAAFIHTLITFKQNHACEKLSLQRMLAISGYVGNVAGALKVQSRKSLEFPKGLHTSVDFDQCLNESVAPSTIGKFVLKKHLNSTTHRNYYSFLHEL